MDIVDRLRRMYVDQGTNHVQEAADTIERLRAELYRTKLELSESRLDERQAMAYLSAIQKIVGGETYPDVIELVRKQHLEKTHYIDAWSDMCDENQRLRNEFDALRERLK